MGEEVSKCNGMNAHSGPRRANGSGSTEETAMDFLVSGVFFWIFFRESIGGDLLRLDGGHS